MGGVARAHGIRGEVAIVTHDPDSVILGSCGVIWIDGVEHAIVEARDTQRGWLVVLAGITTRNDAELLRGKPVEVRRDALALGEGEVILHDLIGCKVLLPDGTPWGEVAGIDAGFQDRLIIYDGPVERLLPIVDEFVKTIDLVARTVTVDPPEGLPEIKRLGTV
ncbi:MAG: ribosome maturation factor RimM [Kofleriaceae bacterium]